MAAPPSPPPTSSKAYTVPMKPSDGDPVQVCLKERDTAAMIGAGGGGVLSFAAHELMKRKWINYATVTPMQRGLGAAAIVALSTYGNAKRKEVSCRTVHNLPASTSYW